MDTLQAKNAYFESKMQEHGAAGKQPCAALLAFARVVRKRNDQLGFLPFQTDDWGPTFYYPAIFGTKHVAAPLTWGSLAFLRRSEIPLFMTFSYAEKSDYVESTTSQHRARMEWYPASVTRLSPHRRVKEAMCADVLMHLFQRMERGDYERIDL
jgi:hypothetical protein